MLVTLFFVFLYISVVLDCAKKAAMLLPSFDLKMLLKVAFVKVKISKNFKQNIDETHSKQPKIHRKLHTSLWILKISREKSVNQKARDFCQMFGGDSQKRKTIP